MRSAPGWYVSIPLVWRFGARPTHHFYARGLPDRVGFATTMCGRFFVVTRAEGEAPTPPLLVTEPCWKCWWYVGTSSEFHDQFHVEPLPSERAELMRKDLEKLTSREGA
jgi:hypothetical protein